MTRVMAVADVFARLMKQRSVSPTKSASKLVGICMRSPRRIPEGAACRAASSSPVLIWTSPSMSLDRGARGTVGHCSRMTLIETLCGSGVRDIA